MKILNPQQAGQKSGLAAPAKPFRQVMSSVNGPKNRPLPPALPNAAPSRSPISAAVKGAQAVASRPTANASQFQPATTLERARAHAHAKAQNLVELRSESGDATRQRFDSRLVDLICQELKIEFASPAAASQTHSAANSDRAPTATPPHVPVATVTPISQAAARREVEAKAASAAELIEKIEAFVKSARPGLAITLDGSLGGRVEIERLGPKEVAIRMVGKNGPPTPEEVSRVRDEIRACGLKVGALSVA